MSGAQKGMGKNTRGTKQQLLVDRAVVQDCKSRLTNLCTASIDYKKANDSMPHTWILEYVELHNINRTLRAFIRNSSFYNMVVYLIILTLATYLPLTTLSGVLIVSNS